MEKLSVKGLVIREKPMGENDKLLTLLTAERGKMFVSGKGVRSLKSKNMASCQSFAYSTFVLTKNKSGFWYVSESDLHEMFFGIRTDLDSIALAAYICDVADHASVEENDETALLRLTLNALYALSKGVKSPKQIKAAFELRLAVVSGFAPDLTGCTVCGADGEEMYYLDILEGELVCPDCIARRGHEDVYRDREGEWSRPFISVSPTLLSALRYTVASDAAKFLSFSLPEKEMDEYAAACERYLLHHLGRSFSTLDYYKHCLTLKQ